MSDSRCARSFAVIVAPAVLILSAGAQGQCANWTHALGDMPADVTPRDAVVFDDGSVLGPTEWVAHTHASLDSLDGGGVLRRVAGNWVETQASTSNGSSSLAIHDAGSGAELYDGGRHGVRVLQGGAWTALGPTDLNVQDLAVLVVGGVRALYAAGQGGSTLGPGACIVKRVAGAWVPIAAGFGPASRVYELAAFDSGAGEELYAAGVIDYQGADRRIMRLGAGGWSPVADPPGGPYTGFAYDLEVHDDGGGARLCAAFRTFAPFVTRLALFDGSSWTTIPGDLTGINGTFAYVYEITSHDEDGSGRPNLFVGGVFASAGGVPVTNAARWNGTAWSALGAGLSSGPSSNGMRMLVSEPGTSTTAPRLIAGGWFEQAGGLPAYRIAAWEGCPGTGFVECAGDGSAAACPCGNPGANDAGCANSLGVGGRLQAQGLASLGTDTLELHGGSMPDSSALYFQGTGVLSGGLGIAFGDGLRCAGGSIVRIAVASNVGGASSYPLAGDPPISVRGLVAVPGARHYQVWYRNAAAFCTTATFNLTNGVSVQWGA